MHRIESGFGTIIGHIHFGWSAGTASLRPLWSEAIVTSVPCNIRQQCACEAGDHCNKKDCFQQKLFQRSVRNQTPPGIIVRFSSAIQFDEERETTCLMLNLYDKSGSIWGTLKDKVRSVPAFVLIIPDFFFRVFIVKVRHTRVQKEDKLSQALISVGWNHLLKTCRFSGFGFCQSLGWVAFQINAFLRF